MILTAHQPAYLPWLGYLEKIAQSDIYIYMDTVQFERGSFTNRNKIKTPNGSMWLTIPVLSKGHIGGSMANLKINNDINWQKKHYFSIYNNYKKAPYFQDIIKKVTRFYENRYELLVEFCYDYLSFWMNQLEIKTKVYRLSELEISGSKSELVLNMCKEFHADTYISGAMGIDYLDVDKFKENNVNIIYQDYKPRKYPQLWGNFIPYLSVLDFVMNTNDYALIMGEK